MKNGKVNAADARAALRRAARLEPFPELYIRSCDIDFDGRITAADARMILRVAAKIDSFKLPSIDVYGNEEIVIKNLKTAGSGSYTWQYTISDDRAFEVSQSIAPPEYIEIKPGTPFNQTFIFKPLKPGEYNVHFELIQPWSKDVTNSFDVVFVVK